jgi:hypothetical protein
MREQKSPAIADPVMELDAASRGFGLEIGGDGVDLERHDGPHVILITDEFRGPL